MVTSLAQKDQILSLLQDPYANYVVQRALQVSDAAVLLPPSSFLLPPSSFLLPPSSSLLPPPSYPSCCLVSCSQTPGLGLH